MSDQIDVNQLSNALQQKVDLPSGKSQADIDYVVEWQAPDLNNNSAWYRLYKSGWIEQGLLVQVSNASAGQELTLPKPMADTNYTIQGTAASWASSWTGEAMIRFPMDRRTTTTIYYQGGQTNGSGYCYIEVKGFAAQS